MESSIVVTDSGPIRDVRIARPERRNALTNAMYCALANAIDSADRDPDVAAIVLSSDGPLFTAGNDMGEFRSDPPRDTDAPVYRFLFALARTHVPLVAAVRGPAIGIGTTMLLHCDFVYATPDASFRLPFVDIGLVPEAASSLLLPRLIGRTRAAEMLLLGAPMDATTAERLGLITLVVDESQLASTARATAEALAQKPRAALRAGKALLRGDVAEIEERMGDEGRVFAERLLAPDTVARLDAFLNRR